jgi:outer membrane protein insertion porin family
VGLRTPGVGPRDVGTNDALGANNYYSASGEFRFPLGLPDELGLTGATLYRCG